MPEFSKGGYKIEFGTAGEVAFANWGFYQADAVLRGQSCAPLPASMRMNCTYAESVAYWWGEAAALAQYRKDYAKMIADLGTAAGKMLKG